MHSIEKSLPWQVVAINVSVLVYFLKINQLDILIDCCSYSAFL